MGAWPLGRHPTARLLLGQSVLRKSGRQRGVCHRILVATDGRVCSPAAKPSAWFCQRFGGRGAGASSHWAARRLCTRAAGLPAGLGGGCANWHGTSGGDRRAARGEYRYAGPKKCQFKQHHHQRQQHGKQCH